MMLVLETAFDLRHFCLPNLAANAVLCCPTAGTAQKKKGGAGKFTMNGALAGCSVQQRDDGSKVGCLLHWPRSQQDRFIRFGFGLNAHGRNQLGVRKDMSKP
ncbi:unnamed protein product, partial [Hapterophycus canaliculatus]